MLFQGLFEKFLASKPVTFRVFPPLVCKRCGYRQSRESVFRRLKEGKSSLRCAECGHKVRIPEASAAVALSADQSHAVTREGAEAARRTRYEAVLTQFKSNLRAHRPDAKSPTCFISYAWGNPADEHWVDKRLATDLRNSDIEVKLDRWENSAVGSYIQRFIDQIDACDAIVVVGTPLYLEKYRNAGDGTVVAAEMELIGQRLMGPQARKASVYPALRKGDPTKSFPPLLCGKVSSDFRDNNKYFQTLFDLILSIYQIPFASPGIDELRRALKD